MDIGELWEAIEDRSELFGEGLGRVFDFSGIELFCQLVDILTNIFLPVIDCTFRILLIWKPLLICVGRRR
jgi:hypothetical protein